MEDPRVLEGQPDAVSTSRRFARAGSVALVALLGSGCGSVGDFACGDTTCESGQSCVDGTCQSGSSSSSGAGGSGGDDWTPGGGNTGTAGSGGGGSGICAEAFFPLTETQESFVVPENALYMHVKAWGAGGNHEVTCNGGMGGYTEAVFEVTPFMQLAIIVGGPGSASHTTEELFRFGFGNHGGGGLSGVFLGPDLITETDDGKALVIAGGGGSAGALAQTCTYGIPGNHPDAGGMPTMKGGPGGDDINGGGGGRRGGLGGGHGENAFGGTGVAQAQPGFVMLDSYEGYAEPGDLNLPPAATDPDWDGTAGTTEANGQVVIRFACDEPVIVPK
jgi:hypothetical protein